MLGVLSAWSLYVFMALVHQGTALTWEQATALVGVKPRLFTVLVFTAGGLLVGLLVKLIGDHSGIFAEVMLEFGKTGRFDYRNAPGIVVTAFVSLIAGGSLGPEAPLADANGGMGTVLADRLKLDAQETRTMGYSGVSGMLAGVHPKIKGQLDRTGTTDEILGAENVFEATATVGASTRAAYAAAQLWLQETHIESGNQGEEA